jgi:hypothetical protein
MVDAMGTILRSLRIDGYLHLRCIVIATEWSWRKSVEWQVVGLQSLEEVYKCPTEVASVHAITVRLLRLLVDSVGASWEDNTLAGSKLATIHLKIFKQKSVTIL